MRENFLFISYLEENFDKIKVFIMKKGFLIIFVIFFISSTSAQTYTFQSSGSNDSAENGFKSLVTSPVGADLIVSNNMQVSLNSLQQTSNTTGQDMIFTIKASNSSSTFSVDGMVWRYFLATGITLETDTKIEFYNTSGTLIDIWTLSAPFSMTGNTGFYDIKDIFSKSSGVENVHRMDVTIDTGSINTVDFRIESITINTTLNIGEFEKSNSITLFPNPVKKNININLNKQYGDVNSMIVDLNGKVLFSTKSMNTDFIEMEIPASIKNGIYLIIISNKNKIINSNKVIIKN
ncbi:hypothetical protein BTO05_00790 [Winogradskyella sp. PC-19]|uniref:T9SS type A sorting domain-containing protein n=1 Tax=Winogradskyella sp. PC-19 TaxID=754417 RepID=UPI000B3C042D|nr:T9SS type A sorting domain-containing protein [Winogradskyella sp. PC-19]ARV08243.1 hypothetical protein BTO05_00790 [Winogradskyella sp. PC-19]